MVRRHRKYSRGIRTRFKQSAIDNTRSDIMALWVLRALVYLKGNKNFITKQGFSDDDIVNAIGLSDLADIDDLKSKHANRLISTRLKNIESKQPKQPEDILYNNIQWLGETLLLNAVEKKILLFSIILSTMRDLRDGLNTVTNVDKEQLYYCISVVLDIPIQQCKNALNNNSILISTGLIKIEHDEQQLGDKIRTLSTLLESIFEDYTNPHDILNSFFEATPPPKLKRIDFQHIATDYDLISTYLRSAVEKKSQGVNILIYGKPGVGKTEFVRMLTDTANINLYDIAMKDGDGEAISGDERFSVFQLSQRFLEQQSNCCLLFDEVEDVFPTSGNSFFSIGDPGSRKSSGKKAWINQLLENNAVPTFWLCNQVHQIDPAYIRRFDYVMELQKPNRSGRLRIVNKYLGHLNLDKKWLNDIANNEDIVPAFIEKASKVVEHNATQDKATTMKTIDKVLNNTLSLFSNKKTLHHNDNTNIEYNIDYINADDNIKSICDGLLHFKSGRLCLYGPPGTGKTALGLHIAKYVDQPLIVKRASDILSMWVGGTEANIAKMFQEATDEKAVLLLDEADSFIQSRQSAQHSWEITQVNELLVQMENFEGIFIASTNLLEILDSASLRRFDFKVKFNYLEPESALRIFNNIMANENWDNTLTNDELSSRLFAIPNLAFGDYTVAVRKMLFSANKTNEEFIMHLEREAKLKLNEKKCGIGFTANIH